METVTMTTGIKPSRKTMTLFALCYTTEEFKIFLNTRSLSRDLFDEAMDEYHQIVDKINWLLKSSYPEKERIKKIWEE